MAKLVGILILAVLLLWVVGTGGDEHQQWSIAGKVATSLPAASDPPQAVLRPPPPTEPPTTAPQPVVVAPPTTTGAARPAPPAPGLDPCGGDLPPCNVVARESGGSYTAYNPTGCGGLGCWGKYQFSGEWAGKLGLPLDLSTATPAQQDAAARALWAGGAGCSNWAAC